MKKIVKNFFRYLVYFFITIIVWQLLIFLFSIPDYMLPSPLSVLGVFFDRWDLLFKHTKVTALEILLGMMIGSLVGFFSALLLSLCPLLGRFFMPVLVASQSIPVFAIAPLLILWLGYGMSSKIVMTVLIIFFPITASCFDGLKNTPRCWVDIAHSMNASSFSILWHVKLPAALPALASGLKVAACYAPIGAVVGEWVGSSEGLGYLVLHANARMQTDIVFSAVIILMMFSLLLFFTANSLLNKFIFWKAYNT